MEAPDRLTVSSKKALRWAWAAAGFRASQSGPENSVSESIYTNDDRVNGFDLLVGIMLSHPANSEARVLFEHFGLTLRDVLPDDYPNIGPAELGRARTFHSIRQP